jgi:hypothetical protein
VFYNQFRTNVRKKGALMTASTNFDPARHLTLVSGKEYLEVKWRLVWLRSEHPDAAIETELVSHHDNEAVFRAQVSIPGGGSATGWGSEDARGFGDYLEKAETKAIGRALAALGFGTQFCTDFDFGAAQGRVVDSPVQFKAANVTEGQFDRSQVGADLAATERQRGLIQALARDLKLNSKALDELAREQTGGSIESISRKSASTVIELLKERKELRTKQPA